MLIMGTFFQAESEPFGKEKEERSRRVKLCFDENGLSIWREMSIKQARELAGALAKAATDAERKVKR